MIQKSDSKIPQEWIERIEREGDKNKIDYEVIDKFILKYYATKSINSIAKVIGIGWNTVARRIDRLKKQGKLNE